MPGGTFAVTAEGRVLLISRQRPRLLHIPKSKELSGPSVHKAQVERSCSNVHGCISPDMSSLGPISIIKKFFLKLNANLSASFSKLQSSTWLFHSPEVGTAALQKDHAGLHFQISAAERWEEQSHMLVPPTATFYSRGSHCLWRKGKEPRALGSWRRVPDGQDWDMAWRVWENMAFKAEPKEKVFRALAPHLAVAP